MEKSTLFTNWTKKAFTWNWNGDPWTFEPGKGKWMNNHLARHFAKHLANREITNEGKPINNPIWKEYFNKCLGGNIEAESPEKLESAVMEREMSNEVQPQTPKTEKTFCEECNSKGVRHKKECPTLTVQSTDDESFEGLKK